MTTPKKPKMNYEIMLEEGNIPMLWVSPDKATHMMKGIGCFYRRARPNEWENVSNWATPESYKQDREAFNQYKQRNEL